MSELKRDLTEDIFYPPHDPRKASSRYRKTHDFLIKKLDTPCWICGIRRSDVLKFSDEKVRRHWQLETHHFNVEWAAQNGISIEKITQDWPELTDREKLAEWVDSESNMLVLCAVHHRAGRTGIHSITYPAWRLQRWQGEDPQKEHQFIPQTNWHLLVPSEVELSECPPEVLPQKPELGIITAM